MNTTIFPFPCPIHSSAGALLNAKFLTGFYFLLWVPQQKTIWTINTQTEKVPEWSKYSDILERGLHIPVRVSNENKTVSSRLLKRAENIKMHKAEQKANWNQFTENALTQEPFNPGTDCGFPTRDIPELCPREWNSPRFSRNAKSSAPCRNVTAAEFSLRLVGNSRWCPKPSHHLLHGNTESGIFEGFHFLFYTAEKNLPTAEKTNPNSVL